MKRAVIEMSSTETGIDERDTRIKELERRLEKLDPQPPPEVMQPYSVGSTVFGIADAEASYPLTVAGYDHRSGHILITCPGDPEPRSYALASVRPLEKCCGVAPDRVTSQITDPGLREFTEGKQRALAAAKAPIPPPPRPEPKYRWAD